jgi:fibronectin type 3 domain-containing protein/predicted small lipoprotein YifL
VRTGARAAIALALLLPLALAACGRRGPPVAPERRLPAAVQNLTASMAAEGVRLSWTLPKIRVDRSPLKEVGRTEVYRRDETAGTQATRPAVLSFGGLFGGPAEMVGFERVANIVLADPKSVPTAEIAGTQVTYTDAQGLTYGRRYTYVVVAVDAQGRPSPPSNRITIALAAPPEAPTALAAESGDRQARLIWTAPARLEDGSPAPADLLYNVYRGTTAEARPARPVNPEPLSSPSFVDLGLQNDATYYYSVRALLGPGGTASRPSQVVAVTPEDQTPPAQPRGLVAVVAGGTVRLAWEAVPDADVAGYRVYRSTMPGRGHQPVTPALQTATTYVDSDVRPGVTYYYVVTAVDRARRANESVPSPEASATLP